MLFFLPPNHPDQIFPELHAADTLAAGAGLCDPAIVRLVTGAGPDAIEQLEQWGVAFDRAADGQRQLSLEGAHSRRRVVHAQGDSTGAAIMQALVARAKDTPSITFIEDAEATDLLTRDGIVVGVRYRDSSGAFHDVATRQVVLATGGVGALWQHTTNPLGSWGQGLALAARCGAALRDLEFVQFHPTAMDVALDPMPLASEALRGEGAALVNSTGEAFMQFAPRRDLEPRDIVVRAIWQQLRQGQRVFLDVRNIAHFATRFPTIHASCVAAGIDPSRQPIPILPAAHYHMGGVAVDADGCASVPGLWACGEVAATGLHGANRLASNSLLEAVVMGQRVGRSLRGRAEGLNGALPQAPAARLDSNESRVRALMTRHVGVLRDKAGLEQAVAELAPLAARDDRALVGLMIATAALRREESRGAHTRMDFPATLAKAESRSLTLDELGLAIPATADGNGAKARAAAFTGFRTNLRRKFSGMTLMGRFW